MGAVIDGSSPDVESARSDIAIEGGHDAGQQSRRRPFLPDALVNRRLHLKYKVDLERVVELRAQRYSCC